MWVGNNGTGDIASFYDIDQNIEVLHIGGNNGTFPNIGVKTSTPNKDFTVNGEISSNNVVYDRDGNSVNWNSVYSNVQANSANAASVYSSVAPVSSNWDSVYSSVASTSANWDSVYSSVASTSANWATQDYLQTNFLTLSGGTITGAVTSTSTLEVGSGPITLIVEDNAVSVNGTLSSNSIVYDQTGNSTSWNSVHSHVMSNSSVWVDFKDTPSIAVGALFLNLTAGNLFFVTMNSSLTSVTLTGIAASPRVVTCTLQFSYNSNNVYTVTWPSSFKWAGGVAPTLTCLTNKVDTFTFMTHTGGTTWYAYVTEMNQ